MKLKSVMTSQERFATIESSKISRSTFDRSHGHKTTIDAGLLYPVFCEEALPGDTFNVTPTIFGRFATPLKPLMDNIYVDIHFFSVPYRLVWDNFVKMMGEQTDPGDSTDYIIPTVTASDSTGHLEGSIYDYFGIPTKVPELEHSSLPLRAYNLIYNEWYRDENLIDSVTVPKGDGPDFPINFNLLYRSKRKDYFTSALPWAQKAEPVTIPLNQFAPVTGLGTRTNVYGAGPVDVYETGQTSTIQYAPYKNSGGGSEGNDNELYIQEDPDNPGFPLIRADLSQVEITINALRQAATLQQLYEKDARGGTRYIEVIKSHFNVTSPDARLQRPEFLGGGSSPLTMTPVVQNSASEEGGTPQGNLAAFGTVGMTSNGFVKTFTEHEIILGILSIRADLNYQQGLNRMWSRSTRYDFYWPTFAHLGEQAILNKEIYAQGSANPTEDDAVFGYQERYAEYRYKPSIITGKFRSNATASLDVWHVAQDFSSLPALNGFFIRDIPPIDRVIAVPSEPAFIVDMYFNTKAARPMPVYSTPGITKL